MSRNLYVTTTGPAAGKSAVVLGLMSLLKREIRRVGYFRPIAKTGMGDQPDPDPNIRLIREVYNLDTPPEKMAGVPERRAMELFASGRADELMEEILEAYKSLEASCDFVLIEGTNYQGITTAFEFDVNADIARNLAAPVLLVVSGRERSAEEILDHVVLSHEQFDERGCDLLAALVNRVTPDQWEAAGSLLPDRLEQAGIPLAGMIPEDEILARPRMDEVARSLGARVMYGERYLDNLISSFKLGSMQLPQLLERLEPGALVITAGDRTDILLGLLAAQLSRTSPKLSGVLLTGGLEPTQTVHDVIRGLRETRLPVLAVETGTYQSAVDVSQVAPAITPGSYRKIETARLLFDEYVQADVIRAGITSTRADRLTPQLFLYNLIERARQDRQHIVLPEGAEERIIRAVDALIRRGVADLTLLGEEEEIRSRAEKCGVSLEGVSLVDPSRSERLEEYADTYYELRKHKVSSRAMACELMQDPTYFGTMMVHLGHAGGMVSGSVNTTAHTVRPALEFIKTRPGLSLVSSVFFMCLADRVLVYGDCAINPNPTAKQLAGIAVSSADTAAAFGLTPRVAMLSYATGASSTGQEVEKVKEATALAHRLRPDLAIDGPIQYDAAVDAGVARAKLPESDVAGRANVFIFPDLNTGNNTYKAVQRSAGALAVGPVLQGLRRPVNDLSRGCTVADIVNTVAITAIQAQQSAVDSEPALAKPPADR